VASGIVGVASGIVGVASGIVGVASGIADVRFVVDAWAPDYGGSVEEPALEASDVPTDITVEVPVASWGPRTVPGEGPARVVFVDGVRRVEARVWITGDDGEVSQGICASYGAGAVRCDGRAELVAATVRRALFTTAPGAGDLETRHGRFALVPVLGDDPDRLSLCLQQKMGELEVAVAREAGTGCAGEPIVVDGPLRQHRHLPGAVGYVKGQHRFYGAEVVRATVGALLAGQRTPVFAMGEAFTRYSWYVRLPGERNHALAGIARCEASTDLGIAAVVAVADRVTALLPRFSSRPHKDPRAPQNLYPIAGLERELRRRLGDPALLYRALRRAAASASAP